MSDVTKLQQEIHILRELLSEKDHKIARQESQLVAIKEHMRLLLVRRFGASSEKISPETLVAEAEAQPVLETTTVKSHERKARPRVSIPAHLSREEIMPDSEKVCPKDGMLLNVIGSDGHEQLDIIPAQIKVLLHRRLKYACPCCEQYIVTAGKPKQPIEKSIASVLSQKFAYRCLFPKIL